MTPIRLLLTLLDQAYDRRSWHGTNLRGSIRGLDADAASWRPGRGRHNIHEIVVHAAYWNYAVRRRLTGEKRGGFALKGSNWFTRDRSQWREDVALLAASHRALRETVAGLTEADLRRRTPGTSFDGASLVGGIIAHDLYHAGQIQLLKRLRAGG